MQPNKNTVIYLISISRAREKKTTDTSASDLSDSLAPHRQEIRDDATRATFPKIRALDILDRISRC